MSGLVPPHPVIGRFAPSPTGPLHFGSLLTAVASYCLARQAGGRWMLRIEDLDLPRVVPGAADEIMRTLDYFALEWDDEVLWQSRRTPRYDEVLEELRRQGHVFGCGCSRKEVLASAPHVGEEGPVYPGTCRDLPAGGHRPRAVRLRVPNRQVCFTDAVGGELGQCLATEVGDFVLRRADGLFAYQLAVVVDDADSGVTQVVRGSDLISSTPRQIYLQSCLGYPHPHYVHLPLALAADGEKISKRHGAVPVGGGGAAGEPLWRALRFLGQEVPGSLRRASAREVLAWGVAFFDIRRVPRESRIPGEV